MYLLITIRKRDIIFSWLRVRLSYCLTCLHRIFSHFEGIQFHSAQWISSRAIFSKGAIKINFYLKYWCTEFFVRCKFRSFCNNEIYHCYTVLICPRYFRYHLQPKWSSQLLVPYSQRLLHKSRALLYWTFQAILFASQHQDFRLYSLTRPKWPSRVFFMVLEFIFWSNWCVASIKNKSRQFLLGLT